jgi:hypothetical protein
MRTFKVLVKIILIAAMSYLLQNVMGWWAVALAAFLINLIIFTKGLSSFVSGFLGVGILWFFKALITDFSTGAILSEKVADIFNLPGSTLLVIITAFIGGMAGGSASVTGSALRSWIMPQPNDM